MELTPEQKAAFEARLAAMQQKAAQNSYVKTSNQAPEVVARAIKAIGPRTIGGFVAGPVGAAAVHTVEQKARIQRMEQLLRMMRERALEDEAMRGEVWGSAPENGGEL